MYDIQFIAASGSDWAEAIELIDDDTNLPFNDADDATFDLAVTLRGGSTLLSASTTDATISRPAANQILWNFTAAHLGSLCPGTTYTVGCRMTIADGSIALFTGSLAYIDGGVR